MSTHLDPTVGAGHGQPRPLYVFSPLPPQRNGLADYLMAYLPMLRRDFALHLVSEAHHTAQARQALATEPGVTVIDESEFLARQPDARAQVFYNLGNNGDCAYALDHLHRFPGVVLIHDVSLFYLHQVAAQRARLNGQLGHWLLEDDYRIPDDFMGRDGSVVRTPGTLYQECLMVRRIAASARAVMVHTAYAERRLRGGTTGIALGGSGGKPLSRIPHFVLPTPDLGSALQAEVLGRFGIQPEDRVLLVPGFLTGNKMLYEVLVAFHRVSQSHPGMKLFFAGEERPDEYDVSKRIRHLWPDGDGPVVTGYLEADALDVLLARADLSFVLRHPTYGESSGILPRAAMGGGHVATVDIGAYAEFRSPQVTHVPVGPGTVDALESVIRRVATERLVRGDARAARCAAEADRAASLTPAALYPGIKALLDAAWEARP